MKIFFFFFGKSWLFTWRSNYSRYSRSKAKVVKDYVRTDYGKIPQAGVLNDKNSFKLATIANKNQATK